MTSHTLSSQVSCLNHLFLLRNDKQAVLSIIKNIDKEIVDLFEIVTDNYKPAYIQFEAVSDKDHLNEKRPTRGSNCTSIEALIYGVRSTGEKLLFPIEWKYTEYYGNQNKAEGKAGDVRKKRYTGLIENSTQLKTNSHDILYVEPFYQLMRQTLWAEQMIANKADERIQADDFIHLHIIPKENSTLLAKKYLPEKDMETTWRNCLINQDKYKIIAPKDFLQTACVKPYEALFEYLDVRYWRNINI